MSTIIENNSITAGCKFRITENFFRMDGVSLLLRAGSKGKVLSIGCAPAGEDSEGFVADDIEVEMYTDGIMALKEPCRYTLSLKATAPYMQVR